MTIKLSLHHLEVRNSPKDPVLLQFNRLLEAKKCDYLILVNDYPFIKILSLHLCLYERLFSLGGRVLFLSRSLLSDDQFEMLVFLKGNGNVESKDKSCEINYQ